MAFLSAPRVVDKQQGMARAVRRARSVSLGRASVDFWSVPASPRSPHADCSEHIQNMSEMDDAVVSQTRNLSGMVKESLASLLNLTIPPPLLWSTYLYYLQEELWVTVAVRDSPTESCGGAPCTLYYVTCT